MSGGTSPAIIFDAGLEKVQSPVGRAAGEGGRRDGWSLVPTQSQSGHLNIAGRARGTPLLMQIDHWAKQILSIESRIQYAKEQEEGEDESSSWMEIDDND